ncbi:hypothetical protein MFIFM68171_10251 [Madurella fahalii]|uniref:Uncharacterized protein n=1 Tax=Madurella fahalii TaxID=1157608 RepID=A0ABQ0GQL8_9PEZI
MDSNDFAAQMEPSQVEEQHLGGRFAATALTCINNACRIARALREMVEESLHVPSPILRFFSDAPGPFSIVLLCACCFIIPASIFLFSTKFSIYLFGIGLSEAARDLRGIIVGIADDQVFVPAIKIYHMIHNRFLPKLPPLGDLGSPPTIQWAVQDSLVVMTEEAAQGVQYLLERCAVEATPNMMLQLNFDIAIECAALNSQLDGPPYVTTLRRTSKNLQTTVNKELNNEFNAFARFLYELRRYPATEAIKPQAPESVFESRLQVIRRRLRAGSRTVWYRWIRRNQGARSTSAQGNYDSCLRGAPPVGTYGNLIFRN